LYSAPSVIRKIRWREIGRACSMTGGEEDIGGKARRKETLRKTKT
jgi:hypothetical protein